MNKVPNQGNPIEHWTDDTVTVQSGDALKNGDQVFKYWSTTANDETGSKHYKTGNTFTITENTVLYAIYDDAPGSDSGKEYTVTYDKNGGTGTEPKDENKYSGGETVTVKDKGSVMPRLRAARRSKARRSRNRSEASATIPLTAREMDFT